MVELLIVVALVAILAAIVLPWAYRRGETVPEQEARAAEPLIRDREQCEKTCRLAGLVFERFIFGWANSNGISFDQCSCRRP